MLRLYQTRANLERTGGPEASPPGLAAIMS